MSFVNGVKVALHKSRNSVMLLLSSLCSW